jgi:hypothetical protein
MMRTILYSTAFAAFAALAACGGAQSGRSDGAFDSSWQNDRGESIARVENMLRTAPRTPNAQVVVGVTETGLVGSAIDGKGRWEYRGPVEVMPIIAGDLVLSSGAGKVYALDAKSGQRVWEIDSKGRELYSAGSDGKLVAVVLAGEQPTQSTLLALRRSGEVLHELGTDRLGRPAVRGGVAFVPWGDQYVSAVDLESGDEIGRLLLREIVSVALNAGGELFFGQDGLVRLDDKINLGWTNQARRIGLPSRALPGKPEWLGSGYLATPVTNSARTKIRVYATWPPTSASPWVSTPRPTRCASLAPSNAKSWAAPPPPPVFWFATPPARYSASGPTAETPAAPISEPS